jgi:hypothetical protein
MEREDSLRLRGISSLANCKQHIPVPSSASTGRVGEQASEITVRSDILAWVCERHQIFGKHIRNCSRDLFLFFVVFPERRVLLIFFRRLFEGLQGVHLPASNLYGYIEHIHEVSHVNGAIDALSIGLSVHSVLRICACFIVVYCLCE